LKIVIRGVTISASSVQVSVENITADNDRCLPGKSRERKCKCPNSPKRVLFFPLHFDKITQRDLVLQSLKRWIIRFLLEKKNLTRNSKSVF